MKYVLLGAKVLLVFTLALLPSVVMTLAGWSGTMVIGGMALAGVTAAAIVGGFGFGAIVSVVLPIAAALGMLVRETSWAVALLMVALGGLYGWWAAAGLGSGAVMVPTLVPYFIQDPPKLFVDAPPVIDMKYALGFIGVFVVSGVWVSFLVGRIVLKGKKLPKPAQRPGPAVAYGMILGAAAGITAVIALSTNKGVHWAWITLTIFALSSTTGELDAKKVRDRLTGTAAGFLLAILIFSLPLGVGIVGVMALLCLTGAMVLLLSHKPYWSYVSLMTPAVVLLDSAGTDNSTWVAEQRLLFTLLGAVIAIVVTVVANHALRGWLRDDARDHAANHDDLASIPEVRPSGG